MFILPHLFKRRHARVEKITHDPRYSYNQAILYGVLPHLEFNLKRYTQAEQKIQKIKAGHRYQKSLKKATQEKTPENLFIEFINKFEKFITKKIEVLRAQKETVLEKTK